MVVIWVNKNIRPAEWREIIPTPLEIVECFRASVR